MVTCASKRIAFGSLTAVLGGLLLLAAGPAPAAAKPRPAEGSAVPIPAAAAPKSGVIYRASGVYDSGDSVNAGVATTIICTNFDTVSTRLNITLRDTNGDILAGKTFTVDPTQTFTASTHGTALFFENSYLTPGTPIMQGSVGIASTTPKVFCSVMIVDAEDPSPVAGGISLHLVRYAPVTGTTE